MVKQFYLTLSGATSLHHSGPRCKGNEGVLRIPPRPQAGALLSDGFISYPAHLVEGGGS